MSTPTHPLSTLSFPSRSKFWTELKSLSLHTFMATWASEKQKPFPVSVTPQVSVRSSAFPAQFIDRGCGVFVLGSLGSWTLGQHCRLEGETARRGHGECGRFSEEADRHESSDNHGHSLRCLLYTSPSPRDQRGSRMPSSA